MILTNYLSKWSQLFFFLNQHDPQRDASYWVRPRHHEYCNQSFNSYRYIFGRVLLLSCRRAAPKTRESLCCWGDILPFILGGDLTNKNIYEYCDSNCATVNVSTRVTWIKMMYFRLERILTCQLNYLFFVLLFLCALFPALSQYVWTQSPTTSAQEWNYIQFYQNFVYIGARSRYWENDC
jgi:hypothetical protein